jgi:basic membrane protein A
MVLLVVLAVFFCGCTKTESWKSGQPLAKDKIKIGLVYPNEPNTASIYDYAHYEGVARMQKELGLADSQIIRKFNVFDGDAAAAENAMRDCIAEGANIIIAPSWGYMDTCEKLAAEFPRIIFAHGTGYKRNAVNFTNYSGRVYQARYLSGVVAGLKTKSNKIGYVAAMGKDNSEVSGGLNAFALGVERVNPNAKVYVKVTHNWFDIMGATEAANALIAAGCDVITCHTNDAAAQIAAQKAGIWAIGFNGDMNAVAPDAVITSVVINWGVYYTHLAKSVMDGSFTTTPYYGGLAQGMVGITPVNASLAVSGTLEAVERERRRIIAEGFNVFDGVLETNDGETVGKEGSTLSDDEILGGINWYYRNIIEVNP